MYLKGNFERKYNTNVTALQFLYALVELECTRMLAAMITVILETPRALFLLGEKIIQSHKRNWGKLHIKDTPMITIVKIFWEVQMWAE